MIGFWGFRKNEGFEDFANFQLTSSHDDDDDNNYDDENLQRNLAKNVGLCREKISSMMMKKIKS